MTVILFDLELSCTLIAGELRVFLCKNDIKIDITSALTDHELEIVREKYDLEKLRDWAYGPEL